MLSRLSLLPKSRSSPRRPTRQHLSPASVGRVYNSFKPCNYPTNSFLKNNHNTFTHLTTFNNFAQISKRFYVALPDTAEARGYMLDPKDLSPLPEWQRTSIWMPRLQPLIDQIPSFKNREELRNSVAVIDGSDFHLKHAYEEPVLPDLPQNLRWFNVDEYIQAKGFFSFDKSLKDKIVVFYFWTTSSLESIRGLKDFQALSEKYKYYTEVAFVSVHTGKFPNELIPEQVQEALIKHNISLPTLLDNEGTVWNSLHHIYESEEHPNVVDIEGEVEDLETEEEKTPGDDTVHPFEDRYWPTLYIVGPTRYPVYQSVSGDVGLQSETDEYLTAALVHYSELDALSPEPVPASRALEPTTRHTYPLKFPSKLTVDAGQNLLFVADSSHYRIVVTGLDGKYQFSVGSGKSGFADGSFEQAQFNEVAGVAYHPKRNVLLVADPFNHAIRHVDLNSKKVTTLIGNGKCEDQIKDNVPLSPQVSINLPYDIVFNGSTDEFFVAMAGTNQIFLGDLEKKTLVAYAGTERAAFSFRTGFTIPSGLTVNPSDQRLYVADSNSSSVQEITKDKIATYIAGGNPGFPGDYNVWGDKDGLTKHARLQFPKGVLFVEPDKLFVADTFNHKVKLVDLKRNTITSLVGTGQPGGKAAAEIQRSGWWTLSSDSKTSKVSGHTDPTAAAASASGAKTEHMFSQPSSLAFVPGKTAGGTLFVADCNNHSIKCIDLATNQVTSLDLSSVPQPPSSAK